MLKNTLKLTLTIALNSKDLGTWTNVFGGQCWRGWFSGFLSDSMWARIRSTVPSTRHCIARSAEGEVIALEMHRNLVASEESTWEDSVCVGLAIQGGEIRYSWDNNLGAATQLGMCLLHTLVLYEPDDGVLNSAQVPHPQQVDAIWSPPANPTRGPNFVAQVWIVHANPKFLE